MKGYFKSVRLSKRRKNRRNGVAYFPASRYAPAAPSTINRRTPCRFIPAMMFALDFGSRSFGPSVLAPNAVKHRILPLNRGSDLLRIEDVALNHL